jgi:hypothetical protein
MDDEARDVELVRESERRAELRGLERAYKRHVRKGDRHNAERVQSQIAQLRAEQERFRQLFP